jgi:hypothetical protein
MKMRETAQTVGGVTEVVIGLDGSDLSGGAYYVNRFVKYITPLVVDVRADVVQRTVHLLVAESPNRAMDIIHRLLWDYFRMTS